MLSRHLSPATINQFYRLNFLKLQHTKECSWRYSCANPISSSPVNSLPNQNQVRFLISRLASLCFNHAPKIKNLPRAGKSTRACSLVVILVPLFPPLALSICTPSATPSPILYLFFTRRPTSTMCSFIIPL